MNPLELLDIYGINISINNQLFRALINSDRTRFQFRRVEGVKIEPDTILVDDQGAKHNIEEYKNDWYNTITLKTRRI